jgi:ketosteroid isomerase-like protein
VARTPIEIAHEGFEAWRRGDFETIEGILDPKATWRWFEPGEWDCHSRDDIMRTLRERHEQGFAVGDPELREAGDDTVIVVSHPAEIGGPEWPAGTATVLRFRGERVVEMQDYRSDADALAAPGAA